MAFDNMNLLGREENQKQITTEEAVKIADEIYGKIKLKEENYELDKCNEEYKAYNGEPRKIWIIEYYKKYNNIINPYEKLKFNLIIGKNDVKVSSIYTEKSGVYEDNPEVISKEEAIEIATNKEQEFNKNPIININTKKGIKKINQFIYMIENNIDKININNMEANVIETSNIVRNVWVVEIKHNIELIKNADNLIKEMNKEYYIDITTGEIIGGNIVENR